MTKVTAAPTLARTLTGRRGHPCMHPSCEAPSWPDAPVPICERHYIEIARHYETVIRPDMSRRLANVPSIVAMSKPLAPAEQYRVYFIQLGNQIKIGFTSNMRRRMACLSHERILGTIPGGGDVEKRWHLRFAHLRTAGEWFRAEQELIDAINEAVRAS